MASSIKNELAGLRPVTTPKHIVTVLVATGETIYMHGPVTISPSTGTASALIATPTANNQVAGVALNHATAGEEVQVCVDDTQLYSVIADGGTIAQLKALVWLSLRS